LPPTDPEPNILAQLLVRREVRWPARPQQPRQLELGAHGQPAREVVALRVEQHALDRHRADAGYERNEIVCLAGFGTGRQAERERPEGEQLGELAP
jgi:hypothetical protein